MRTEKYEDEFQSLVEQTDETGFHSQYNLPVFANLLDRTLKV